MGLGRALNYFLRLFLVIFTLLGLSGCLFGNAEGYPGSKPSADTGSAPAPLSPGTTQYYYQLDPSYTCVPTGGGAAIHSYRNKIAVSIGGFVLLGDLCHSTSQNLVETEISFSSDRKYLLYQEGIYQYFSSPPVALENRSNSVTAWCRSKDLKSNPSFELTLFPNQVDSATQWLAIQSVVPAPAQQMNPPTYVLVIEKEDTVEKFYDIDSVHVRIHKEHPLAVDFTYDGGFTARLNGTAYNSDLQCWNLR